ncbi:MAG TPA: hypothetical protein VM534_09160, partial [Thermoanaerobaculia bacterium]|nr:hypothetical protein [Thermoanaerobaculia bacterium]
TNTTEPLVATRFDPNADAPQTDEFIIGFEHELMPEFTVGVNYTHRVFDNFIWARTERTPGSNDFYTSADYVPGGVVTGTTPDGTTYSQPYWVLDEVVSAYSVIMNRPDYEQTYKGIELTAVKRMSNRWMLRGNVSWNDWKQNVGPNGFTDPTSLLTGYGCSNCDGEIVVQGSGGTSGAKGGVYINSEWQYVVTGVYQIPVIETNFGLNLSGRQGYPTPYVHTTNIIGNEFGRKGVLVNGVDGARLEDIHVLDLRLSKELRLQGVGLTLSVDAFNVTNEQTVMQRNLLLRQGSNAGAARPGGRITELVSPRVFRVGARLTF